MFLSKYWEIHCTWACFLSSADLVGQLIYCSPEVWPFMFSYFKDTSKPTIYSISLLLGGKVKISCSYCVFDVIHLQLISKYFLFKYTVHFTRVQNKYSHSYSLSWRRPSLVKYKKLPLMFILLNLFTSIGSAYLIFQSKMMGKGHIDCPSLQFLA